MSFRRHQSTVGLVCCSSSTSCRRARFILGVRDTARTNISMRSFQRLQVFIFPNFSSTVCLEELTFVSLCQSQANSRKYLALPWGLRAVPSPAASSPDRPVNDYCKGSFIPERNLRAFESPGPQAAVQSRPLVSCPSSPGRTWV